MTAGRLFSVQPDMHTADRAFFGGKPFAQPVSADRKGRATDLFRTSISWDVTSRGQTALLPYYFST